MVVLAWRKHPNGKIGVGYVSFPRYASFHLGFLRIRPGAHAFACLSLSHPDTIKVCSYFIPVEWPFFGLFSQVVGIYLGSWGSAPSRVPPIPDVGTPAEGGGNTPLLAKPLPAEVAEFLGKGSGNA